MEQLTLDGDEVEVDTFGSLAPFDGTCPVCRAEVLVVELDGQDVVAEFDEVLEEFPCPQCSQVEGMGHARSRCLRCSDGVVGEPLPEFGVAVDEAGRARYFTGGERRRGEAVHRLHVCAVGPR